jgi:branched-chain amino acid aminotransferase
MNSIEKSSLKIDRVKDSRLLSVNYDNLPFGKIFSDHMFSADFIDGSWKNLQILPYGPLSLSPASSALHYGQAIFEGMKAQKNSNGDVLLFRPKDNFNRINRSAKRLCIPELPEEIFMNGLVQLLKTDAAWVPDKEGFSLYIRPFMFATDPFIGVRPSDTYKFIIFSCPVAPYYSEPVKVKIEDTYVRASEGGVGFSKAAGNYAAALYPSKLAQDKGYQQLIWTDSSDHKYIEEAGTMNILFVINNTLITPPINNTTLAGITRDSVLTIARDWKMKVEERKITVHEVIDAIEKGTLTEAFGTGTAATIANISKIAYGDKEYNLKKIDETFFSYKVKDELNKIKSGQIPDRHNWIHIIPVK